MTSGCAHQVVWHVQGKDSKVDTDIASFLQSFRASTIPCSLLAWVVVDVVSTTASSDAVALAVEEWDTLLGR
jgi:hypothetical protein